MAPLCAGNNAVRTDDHITVKVHVHFQGRQDNKIKLIDISAFVERICILGCGYFNMIWIFLDRFNCSLIKILCIHKRPDQSFFQKFTHRSCDSSESQTHLDTALFHDFAERNRRGDGGPSDTRLIRKAVLEVWCVDDKLGTVISHHDFSHICSRFGGSCRNLVRIADRIHHTHIIHICHGYAGRNIGERNEAVGYSHYLIRILGVCHGIG